MILYLRKEEANSSWYKFYRERLRHASPNIALDQHGATPCLGGSDRRLKLAMKEQSSMASPGPGARAFKHRPRDGRTVRK